MKRVLQLNVRLSEGGASGVARTLHDTLEQEGFASRIAYGYGPSGGASPLEVEYDALRLTSRTSAALNMAAHRIRGEEAPAPAGGRLGALRRAVDEADLVHLHAVHSYMLPPTGLMKVLIDAGKPVVWTMHDQWLMTGRCAQPGTCQGWRTGCDPCPHLQAYPPAINDRAAVQFTRRRAAFRALQSAGGVRVVACAGWLATEMEAAGFDDVSVITNSVDPAFWEAVRTTRARGTVSPTPRYLFMSRDLRDPVKVDLPLLRSIAGSAPGRVTIVGDNNPDGIDGAVHRPAVRDREEMVRLMREHTHLLFFSKVDYYPLTIAEALCADMQVIATPSAAADEFKDDDRVRVVGKDEDWVAALHERTSFVPRSTLPNSLFEPRRMAAQYATLYRGMLS